MHEGQLTRARARRRGSLNRYYYQTRIPIKDALILAKSEDPAFRRAWIRRIHDHDGDGPGETAAWRCGCGWPTPWAWIATRWRAAARVLPGVRFACDAYVELVRDSPLVVAVASSLTEIFAPDLMSKRIAAWEKHYPWVGAEALGLLPRPRARAPGATARRRWRSCVDARAVARAAGGLRRRRSMRKTEILWHLLDCVQAATAAEPRR